MGGDKRKNNNKKQYPEAKCLCVWLHAGGTGCHWDTEEHLVVTLWSSSMFKVIMKKCFWLLPWALTCLASFTEHCLLHCLALPPEWEEETSAVPIAKAMMDSSGLSGYRPASESGDVTVSETAYNAISRQHGFSCPICTVLVGWVLCFLFCFETMEK